VPRSPRSRKEGSQAGAPGFQPAPFDVVEASRRVWLERWDPDSASGMAVFTAVLRSYQLLNDRVNSVMKNHDFTFARYEVLAWLETDPESSLTLSWISKTLRIPPATVTDIIDRLEQDKLVRRVPHPTDARTTLAVITPKGQERSNQATKELNEVVYSHIGLNMLQRTQLINLLTVLRANGDEFDVAHSGQFVEEVSSRERKRSRAPRSNAG